MYIVKVLVEHPVHSLDTTFDYLSHEPLLKGIRVWIRFGYQKIIGYVESIEETVLSQEELEKQVGFHYQYIIDVIDEEPLLNEELQDLANQLSRMTLSPRISCLQAMLPTQLKPASHQAVGMKTQLCVEVIMDQSAKTVKQQECLSFLKKHPDIPLKEVPYSRALLKNLEKQGVYKSLKKKFIVNLFL